MSGSFNTPVLSVSRVAADAVLAARIVKPSASDGAVVLAAAASDKLCGVSGADDVDAGEVVSVATVGIVPVVYGGTVAAGDPLTADANGAAVVATAGQRVIGFAAEQGDADTIGSVLLAPGYVPNA